MRFGFKYVVLFCGSVGNAFDLQPYSQRNMYDTIRLSLLFNLVIKMYITTLPITVSPSTVFGERINYIRPRIIELSNKFFFLFIILASLISIFITMVIPDLLKF